MKIFASVTTINMSSGQTNPGYQGNAVRYTTPSRMQELQGQVDEVTDVMRNNIRLELERGGKLDELETKSDMLTEHSRQFQATAKKVKNKYWWQNFKLWIIIIIIVIALIVIISLIAYFTTKKKDNP